MCQSQLAVCLAASLAPRVEPSLLPFDLLEIQNHRRDYFGAIRFDLLHLPHFALRQLQLLLSLQTPTLLIIKQPSHGVPLRSRSPSSNIFLPLSTPFFVKLTFDIYSSAAHPHPIQQQQLRLTSLPSKSTHSPTYSEQRQLHAPVQPYNVEEHRGGEQLRPRVLVE